MDDVSLVPDRIGVAARLRDAGRAARRARLDPTLIAGSFFVFAPLVAAFVARAFVSRHGLQIFAFEPSHAPAHATPLGTDSSGRDILASLVYGTPPTYELGFVAGAVGTVLGVITGLVSGYYGGVADGALRGLGDILLGIPAFALLIVIGAVLGAPSIAVLALVIAALSWPLPARAIRSQVLSLREQPFVVMARLSGRNPFGIVFCEILPNVLSLISAILVGAVSGALLIAIGLQLLGLGPTGVTTLGLTLQTAISGGALSEGMWWWWLSPTVLLVLLFFGLFLMSLAVDQIANPRLRRETAHG